MKTIIASALVLAACSDPAPDLADRHPAPQVAHDEVAVLFMNVALHASGSQPSELHLEVIRANTSGHVPDAFRLALPHPPALFPVIPTFPEPLFPDGEIDPVFLQPRAPAAAAIGQVVIGPASELDALPAAIPFDFLFGRRNMGELIAPYLPHTTITGYQVIYAEGAADAAIYPTFAALGLDGQPITDGLTLVDARDYFQGIVWHVCSEGPLGATLASPVYAACQADNHALIDCLDRCDGEDACTACRTRFPEQIDRDHCLFEAAQPALLAACGPQRIPSPDQIEILDDHATLSVTPADDIRSGILIQHFSSAE